jgi:hypothetical protein
MLSLRGRENFASIALHSKKVVDFLKELSSKNTTFAPQVWLAQMYRDLQSK